MSCVLIIDDDDLVREIVKAMLVSEGHEVVLALDGQDGIRQFNNRRIDLVVCDVFMPNQDGIETLRELRRMNAGLPIVMMTGGATATQTETHNCPDVDFLRMTVLLGATKTIAKPFEVDELVALVQRCLGSRTQASAAGSIAGCQ
jgi:CheY-like chemotaxis protein